MTAKGENGLSVLGREWTNLLSWSSLLRTDKEPEDADNAEENAVTEPILCSHLI